MLIFVCSTGRCGTKYMSEVFRTLTGIPSYHEPQPWCVNETLENVNNDALKSKATSAELNDKINQIKESIYNGWYFESSQVFIKSYFYEVLLQFNNIGVIYIERNPLDLLLSYTKKCRQLEGGWFLRSNWKGNILCTKDELPFYENILWQQLEVRERYKKYKNYFDKTYELKFDDLNKPAEWRRLFKHFGIKHRQFKLLPAGLKRNGSDISDNKAMTMIRQNWTKPIMDIKAKDPEYKRREKLIEKAKIIVANNTAEVNRCEM